MLAGQSAEAVEWADRALALMAADDESGPPRWSTRARRCSTSPAVSTRAPRCSSRRSTRRWRAATCSARCAAPTICCKACWCAGRPSGSGSTSRVMSDLVAVRPPRLGGRPGRHHQRLPLRCARRLHRRSRGARSGLGRLDADAGGKRTWLLAERAWLAGELGEPDVATRLAELRAMLRSPSAARAAHELARDPHHRGGGPRGDLATVTDRLAEMPVGCSEPTATCDLSGWTWGAALLAAVRAGVPPAGRARCSTCLRQPDRAVRDDDFGWRLHIRPRSQLRRASTARSRALPGGTCASRAGVRARWSTPTSGWGSRAACSHSARSTRRGCMPTRPSVFLARWSGWRRDELEALQHRLSSGGPRGGIRPAHRTRARGCGTCCRGLEQLRDRPQALHLDEDGVGARVEHPGQAQHDVARADRHLGGREGAAREIASG